MSKITIDEALCTGCGLCAANCPETFSIGDDNVAHVTGAGCGCGADDMASQCPVGAISVV